jgi:serpin B
VQCTCFNGMRVAPVHFMKISHSLLVPVFLLAAHCAADTAPGKITGVDEAKSALARNMSPVPAAGNLDAFVLGNTDFAANMLSKLAKTPSTNLIFSPHSISMALAMTYAGADGDTAQEMKNVLHYNLPEPELHIAANALDLAIESRGKNAKGKDGQPFRLRVTNALFGQKNYPFEAPFLDTLAANYGAGMQLVDYKTNAATAVDQINAWVEVKTENRIKKLLGRADLNELSRLTLVNAVYMNAAWSAPFQKSATSPGAFAAPSGSKSVAMMRQTMDARVADSADGVSVELPFDGGEVSMVFILPNDLGAFESGVTAGKLDAFAKTESAYVSVSVPKFKLEPESIKLAEILQSLGMKTPFEKNADFFKISTLGRTVPDERLHIAQVIHKGFIDVAEEGVEAAAATAVVLSGTTSAPPTPRVIAFNKPFAFGIRDRATGAWLFLGHVVDPTLTQ